MIRPNIFALLIVTGLLAFQNVGNAGIVFTAQGNASLSDRVGLTTGGVVWDDGVTTNAAPRGVTVDSSGTVYWTDASTSPTTNSIYRQGADSSSRVQIATSSSFLGSLRYNPVNNSLLALETVGNVIGEYSLADPNNVVRTGAFHTGGVGANTYFGTDSNFLYFSDSTNILRKSLDGSGVAETVVANTGNQVRGITIVGSRIFWATDGTNNDLFRSRSILDSSEPVTVSSTGLVATARDLTTDGQLLFFVEGNGADRGVYQMNTDFTGRLRLNDLSAYVPFSIAVLPTAIPEPGSVLAMSLLSFGVMMRRLKKRRPGE